MSELRNVLVENNIQVIFVTEDNVLFEYYVSQYKQVQNCCLCKEKLLRFDSILVSGIGY